ncbi:MAG: fumarate reductase subunit C [Rhodocyclales bacterium]|nr:fumarate reductase subunit C [Rhodocyclales bacterium]
MSRRPLVREVPPTSWYFHRPTYLRYMSREITCIFVAAYCVLLVVGLQRLAAGPAAYEAFLLGLKSADSIVFHLLALAASVYHAATWFGATHKAMPIQIGENFVQPGVISGAHYVVWLVLSFVILYLAGVF